MALIRRASYKCYGPDRWILKQGHLSKNMYLIVRGSVRITEDVPNPVTKVMERIERCILKEKKSFGENAVMFNTSRINSVQSISKYIYLFIYLIILVLKFHLCLLHIFMYTYIISIRNVLL